MQAKMDHIHAKDRKVLNFGVGEKKVDPSRYASWK